MNKKYMDTAHSPVSKAHANDIECWGGGDTAHRRALPAKLIEQALRREVPELHGPLLAPHHHLIQVGIGVGHGGRREASWKLDGRLRRVVTTHAPLQEAAVAAQAQEVVPQGKELEDVACVAAVLASAVRSAALHNAPAHRRKGEVALGGEGGDAGLEL